jgi:hypothetical protein
MLCSVHNKIKFHGLKSMLAFKIFWILQSFRCHFGLLRNSLWSFKVYTNGRPKRQNHWKFKYNRVQLRFQMEQDHSVEKYQLTFILLIHIDWKYLRESSRSFCTTLIQLLFEGMCAAHYTLANWKLGNESLDSAQRPATTDAFGGCRANFSWEWVWFIRLFTYGSGTMCRWNHSY